MGPTKEQVDRAVMLMERPTQGDVEWLLQQTSVSGHGLAQLQAEVRALRDELAALREAAQNEREFIGASYAGPIDVVERSVYEQAVKGRQEMRSAYREARATIARVEALCDLWCGADDDTRTRALGDRLRRELRGAP